MSTFFARLRLSRLTARTALGPATGRGRIAAARARARDQGGFLLIEVLISSMIVALMAVATVTGFTALNKEGAEERHRDEAAVLAAQSQEDMRSDPVSTLLAFKEEGGNSYTATVSGTTYTILQKASFGNGSEATGCSATESTKGQGTYVRISSTVTWTHMVVKPVSEAGIITPPTGSALDVEASNGEVPTQGVPVVVKYVASGTTTSSSLEGTTSSQGCVLFAGIPATEATVEVKEAAGIVNRHGTQSWPTEAVTLAPNVLTRHQLKLAHGGSVIAEFTYNNTTHDKHSNNADTGTYEEAVTGDTFVVFNSQMESPPNFEEGSTTDPEPFTGALFEILPAKNDTGFQQTAPSPTEIVRYPEGDLFPFPSPKDWTAWAGDCLENNPENYNGGAVKPEAAPVPPGTSVKIKVPMTYVMLNVYTKSEAEIKAMSKKGEALWPALETAESKPVTITDKKCEGVKPANETVIDAAHVQETTSGSEWGGHLSAPFQPFGEYELCLVSGGKTYRPKAYTNTSPKETKTLNIYLNEFSHAEVKTKREEKEKETQAARVTKENETKATREASESATKSKREASETETKLKRESSEKETKTKREVTEAATGKEREKEETAEKETKAKEEATKAERLASEKREKEAWESEVSKNGKSRTTKEREDKEKEEKQATKRKPLEETEKKAAEKRESEEKATKKKREEEAAAKKAAETKEAETRKAAETKEAETAATEKAKEEKIKAEAVASEEKTKSEAVKVEEKATAEAVAAEEKTLGEREVSVETGTTC